ncbi:hypothetical protein [Tropicibacter oceani]|uniref:Chitin-binding type-2 domain-containing protein n=1 Tax=Tropicibacter oceani TaxID=3058420 RepID=A0ABY8QJC3_9RHOB|nr:hypothetical protein [Tropicibacter oceani]WGW04710.1 hypothetical protein QF118_03930 [Tropicibacter oceani]
MKKHLAAALLACAAITPASTAIAREKTYSPHPWDKGCDAVNCYAPYTSYMTGHYSYLTCKDPHKYLTYRNGVLQCVPHKYVAK